ncbi:hypothetical protein K505DRAFT_408838 [Melanomma pulvis-pyrius CBS 109.77]|uniref:Uncharacterized protein n=1 Tax=Melanomma pulvis-pyrius CBS 109.77 TaxID=1314802 RepID=A0A6A6X6X4_9PLEO|nr:hypothetical protein K505DRAFT_408838 [Melanomma pulvis-pyrius CBS 109.77]
MPPDDWVFDTSSPSSSAKRRLSFRKDDSNYDFKRICIQPPVHQWTPLTSAESTQTLCRSVAALEPVSLFDSRGGTSPELDHSPEFSGHEITRQDLVTVQSDACFGVVIVNATSSFTGSKESNIAPVSISCFGDVLKLRFLDSKKHAGLITLPVLGRLLNEFNVKFTATLAAPATQPKPEPYKMYRPREMYQDQDCTVRIIVYGLKSDGRAIGNMLSDAGLFLQQPSATECDREVEYSNPHYLVRPGSQMPKLEELSLSSDTRNATTPEILDEVNKNRFMQIFDFANDVGIYPRITPSSRLSSTLKSHQLTALTMMAEKECGIVDNPVFPSLWELRLNSGSTKKYHHKITGISESSPTPIYGGILADDMGLGKTLSLLALICSSLDMLKNQDPLPERVMLQATLVITPKSTIPGWKQQIKKHIRPGHMRVAVYHGSSRKRMPAEFKNNDIIITTYETLRSDWIASGPLYSEKWHRLVLDEAHHIRNRSSQTFKAACAIASQYRWCLTGTPIHNSLDDYGALLTFVGVSPFTEKAMFDYWITSAIKEDKADNFQTLQDLVKATCLRRTKSTIGSSFKLPQRVEQIETIQLHPADQDLYDFFKTKTATIAAGMAPRNPGAIRPDQPKQNILPLINFLRLICNHGVQLLPESALEAWKAQNSTSLDWQMMQKSRNRCDMCARDIEETGLLASNTSSPACRHSLCATCAPEAEESCPKCATTPHDGPESSHPSPVPPSFPPSAKVKALLKNLYAEQNPGNHLVTEKPIKSIVFSYWTKMLDLIQQALPSRGFTSQRIDGSTSLEGRTKALCIFNEDPNCTVMLASIGSAGEGVDLTAANHVHLMEPHWNPMAEAQAVDRVHRIGQVREVLVRRYIVGNSIETYIQWIQQRKLKLVSRSLDSEDVTQADLDSEGWNGLCLHLGQPVE